MRIKQHVGNVDIHIDTKRIDRNLKEAQKELNLAVRKDTTPFVPKREGSGGGTLRRSANFPEGVYGGVLEYNTPYAHLLYVGQVYGPNIPIKDSEGNVTGWFSPPGQAKHPTGKKIQYHEPGTSDHWFEKAKERHGDKWLRLVREEARKG